MSRNLYTASVWQQVFFLHLFCETQLCFTQLTFKGCSNFDDKDTPTICSPVFLTEVID